MHLSSLYWKLVNNMFVMVSALVNMLFGVREISLVFTVMMVELSLSLRGDIKK